LIGFKGGPSFLGAAFFYFAFLSLSSGFGINLPKKTLG
jgi:hypothetical protein